MFVIIYSRMRAVTFAQIVAFGAVAVAGMASRDQLPKTAPTWTDWIFIVLFVTLLAWCVQTRVAPVDPKGHEQTRQGFAFRLGKALKGIWRRLRS